MLVSVPCTPFIYSIFPKYQLNIQLTQQRAKQKHGHRRDHRWSPFVFSWKRTKVLHQNGRAVLLTNQVDLDLTPCRVGRGVPKSEFCLVREFVSPKFTKTFLGFFLFFVGCQNTSSSNSFKNLEICSSIGCVYSMISFTDWDAMGFIHHLAPYTIWEKIFGTFGSERFSPWKRRNSPLKGKKKGHH